MTHSSQHIQGRVYLVGSGPGEPELVSQRARRLIETCDALVYDYLTHPALRTWVKPECELINVGKTAGHHAVPQEEIQKILVDKAREGKEVVRLKGGDPFIFGRGGEEAVFLQEHGILFEIVPAVTAALASAAYTGIPLTHREHSSSVTFITGHEDPSKGVSTVDYRAYAKTPGTLCIYMGMSHLREICQQLQQGGMSGDTPLAIVRWASLPIQHSLLTTVAEAAEAKEKAGLGAPALIIIGSVAAFYQKINWFETRPLFGKRVVVTRNREQASVLSDRLRVLGADVIELPLIDIREHHDEQAEDDIWQTLGSYQWIIFTSPNGPRYFFKKFFERFKDIRSIGGVRIACVGETTARSVREHHLEVDFVPSDPAATAEALAQGLLAEESLEHQAVLVVSGSRNRDVLVKQLEGGQAIVDTFTVYETHFTDLSQNSEARRFAKEGADAILFASSSTAENFLKQAGHLALETGARRPKTVSIGPITSQTMRRLGLPVDAQAKVSSIPSLVETTIELVNAGYKSAQPKA